MILTGNEIEKNIEKWKIKISNYNSKNITTNSYDLTLGKKLLKYKAEYLDPKLNNEYEYIEIWSEGFLLERGMFYLASTVEKIWSDHFVPIIHNKSWIARLWLFIHITADLIDIGSYGNSTLQLFSTLPVKIYPWMKIAQVSFWVPDWDIILYKWKYMNSEWPQPSKTYLDFE